MPQPLFSVVICTYERYDRLPRALESVLGQDFDPALFDIWVMDNSPASPRRDASARRWAGTPRLNYAILEQPGLSHARNEGIRLSSGEFIVFLDDDAVAAPNWLSGYRQGFVKAGSEAGAMGGRIMPDFEVPRPAWLGDETALFLSLADWSNRLVPYEGETVPTGANMAIRRAALPAGAPFSVQLGRRGSGGMNLLSGEESALFLYLKEVGWKLFYTPFAEVKHFIPAERLTRAWFRRRLLWQAVSDRIQSGLPTEAQLPLWGHIVDYICHLPPEQVPFMGLCWDTEDPVLFDKQLKTIRYLSILMMSFGDLPPEMKARIVPPSDKT